MFPQVAATNTSSETANTTTHTVNLPSGIVAGDLLIVFMGIDGSPGLVSFPPSGWATLISTLATALKLVVIYKVADGTEGATVVITTDVNERSAHQSYRINQWHGITPPEKAAGIETTSTAADPPSLTPSWGAEDNLWLAAAIINASDNFSADPANYTDPIENDSTGGTDTGVRLRTVRRNLNAATEDPDPFTNSSSPWHALTVAIRPFIGNFGRRVFRGGP